MTIRFTRKTSTYAWLLAGTFAFGCSSPSDEPHTSLEPAVEPAAPAAPATTDALREDAPSTLPLRARLLTSADGALHDTLAVELTNTSSVDAEVWLDLSGSFANLQATRVYSSQALGAGESAVLSVDASELPLQTSVLPVNFVIGAGYHLQNGAAGNVIAGDALGKSSADLSRIALLEPEVEHALDQAAVSADVIGRRFDDAAKEFVNLDASALDLSEGVQVVGFGSDPDAVDDLPEGDVGDAQDTTQKAASTRFCVRMPFSLLDSGFGEDRLPTKTGTMNAAFVRVNVLRSGSSALLFQGFLDANGCTTSVATPAGTYIVRLFSRVGREGKEYWAYDNQSDTALDNWSTNVAIASSTAATVNVTVSPPSDYGAFLAVTSTALTALPEAIFGTVKAFINEGCGNRGPACADRTKGAVFFATDGNNNRLIRQKFAVAHELGHLVQHSNFGLLSVTQESGFEVGPNCDCHQVPATMSNQIHCLQSREVVEMAQNEAFGHYFAARVFNFASVGSDCFFGYYKQFQQLDGSVSQPPFRHDCDFRFRWNGNVCGADANFPNTGTELDWLAFYWGLTTTNANFDFASLRLLYIKACSPSCIGDATCFTVCRGKRINPLNLENAAIAIWGRGSWQHQHVQSHMYNNVL